MPTQPVLLVKTWILKFTSRIDVISEIELTQPIYGRFRTHIMGLESADHYL